MDQVTFGVALRIPLTEIVAKQTDGLPILAKMENKRTKSRGVAFAAMWLLE
jgi:hypothetical protein